MAVRKRIFEEHGLFNVHLGGGASGTYQDTEFGRRLVRCGEKILYEPAAVVVHEYSSERMTQEYVWNRWRQIARSRAYVDVVLYGKKPSVIRNRLRLFRYFARRFCGRLTCNEHKRYRYERKIHYQKYYMAEVARLNKTPQIGHDDS
jgi:GT2 family glycosyltransferase